MSRKQKIPSCLILEASHWGTQYLPYPPHLPKEQLFLQKKKHPKVFLSQCNLQYLLLFDVGAADDTDCIATDNSSDYSGVVVAYDGHVWDAEKRAASCDLIGDDTFTGNCTDSNITALKTYTSSLSTSISSLASLYTSGDNNTLAVIGDANNSTCVLLDNMSCKPSDC